MGETEFEVYRTGWESAISVIAFCAFRPNAFAWASVWGDADNSQGKLMYLTGLRTVAVVAGLLAVLAASPGRSLAQTSPQSWTQ
jgi:hypothetical protein